MRISDLPNEFQLLVACSWAPSESCVGAQAQRIEALCRRGVAWDVFLNLVNRHQVPALAYRALERKSGFATPAAVMDPLGRMAAKARTRSLLAAGECVRIARALAGEGIAMLPLKGAPLSVALYGDPAARHTVDVDFLVREGDVEAAERVLQTLGYQPEFPQARLTARMRKLRRRYADACAYWNPRLQLAVDLHWDQELWSRAQVEELWRRSAEGQCLGAPMRLLFGDVLLLYLCDHGAKHHWSRVKWLSDVAMLLARPRVGPWTELFHLAHQLDAAAALAGAALLVRSLYGLVLPPELSEFVRREGRAPTLAAEAMVAMQMTQDELLQATRTQSIMQRLRNQVLRRPALPLVDHVRARWIHAEDLTRFALPDSLLWLYYLLRPVFRFWRRCLTPGRTVS